jgi:hypothetical protein
MKRKKDERGPFDAVLGVFGRRPVDAPEFKVEPRRADVAILDEVASLDIAIARRQAERIEAAYAEGRQPTSADVALYTSSTSSARASVAEKARLLGTYGAAAGRQDKDQPPTFRVFVSAGKLPSETGADDAEPDPPEDPA